MTQAKYLLAALGLLASQAATAAGNFSANAGMMSDYIYRGVKQKTGSAYAGLDYEISGFYVGTWTADVGQGIEYDLYFGYGGEIRGFSYAVGYTGYFYTDDFDDSYNEINLRAGRGPFSFEYSFGRYGNFSGPELDYGFLAGTLEHKGFYLTYGTFGRDFKGDYLETGYTAQIAGFDFSVAAVTSDRYLSSTGSTETALFFKIGKTFDLGGTP